MIGKKAIIAYELAQGQEIPHLYGLAYRDYLRGIGVCYPIPLNLLVRFVSRVWWKCKQGLWQNPLEKVMAGVALTNFKEGRKFGLKEGKQAGIDFTYVLMKLLYQGRSDEELQKTYKEFLDKEE